MIANYLVKILKMIGITDPDVALKFSLGIAGWGLLISFSLASVIPRFRRRPMYLLCTSSLLAVYTGWTIAQAYQYVHKTKEAGIAVIFFIFLYPLAYNIGYNALTYTYLVEIWPFYARTKGITFFQFWGRSAATLSTQINPIGLNAAGWKWFLIYIGFLVFEIVFIYFIFPETQGKTLEELTFCKYSHSYQPLPCARQRT